MKRLELIAAESSIAELRQAKRHAKNWHAVALALLLREQIGARPGKSRITTHDTAALAAILKRRCE